MMEWALVWKVGLTIVGAVASWYGAKHAKSATSSTRYDRVMAVARQAYSIVEALALAGIIPKGAKDSAYWKRLAELARAAGLGTLSASEKTAVQSLVTAEAATDHPTNGRSFSAPRILTPVAMRKVVP